MAVVLQWAQQMPHSELYPPVDVSPDDYERQVVAWLRQRGPLQSFQVQHQEKISGLAGEYTFDAVARFQAMGGAAFTVLIECKKHRRRVERHYVLALHQKLLDVGAHKAMIFSTAGFQRGAIEYAHKHGIATVHFADGRTAWVTTSRDESTILQLPMDAPSYVGWLIVPSGPSSTLHSQLTETNLQAWLQG